MASEGSHRVLPKSGGAARSAGSLGAFDGGAEGKRRRDSKKALGKIADAYDVKKSYLRVVIRQSPELHLED